MASSTSKQKPFLLFMSFPAEGHTNPCIAIAKSMIQRGYDVAFHVSKEFEPKITAIGAEFIESPAFLELAPPGAFEEVAGIQSHYNRMMGAISKFFVWGMPKRADGLGAALETIRAREGPQRQIIVMHEVASMGVFPFMHGRPLPKGFDAFPKTIGISTIPVIVRSHDIAPFLLGLPYDTSPACIARNKMLYKLLDEGPLGALNEVYAAKLKEAGATEPSSDPLYKWLEHSTTTLQFVCPSLEYPISDLSSSIKFVGAMPSKPPPADFEFPPWWAEMVSQKDKGKKIIFVSQGTVESNYDELIIPTIKAFAGRDDVTVIATLGVRGAALPSEVEIPQNTRVIDYFPYDVILPHASVYVSNAGYGSLCHTAANGCPAVFAGETQDKREVSLRAAWAGIAIDLGTQSPTVEQIREGVDTILSDPKWKTRAMEIKHENEAMDCFSTVEKVIVDLTD